MAKKIVVERLNKKEATQLKIKIQTAAINDMMIIIRERIKSNQESIKFNEKYNLKKYNKRYVTINRDLEKIYNALMSCRPVLIEEVF